MPLVKKAMAVCLAALMLFSFSAVGVFAAEGPTIEETVLVDESNIKITASAFEVTDNYAELMLTFENNTDKNLSFRASSDYGNAVNGYMVDTGYLSTDVAAGKKARETAKFDLDELALYGITGISSIEMGFYVTDDDYDEYLLTPPIHLDTSLAGTIDESEETYVPAITDDRMADALGFTLDHSAQDMLCDAAGVRLISEVLLTNRDGERQMLLEFENTSDAQAVIRLGNFAINGLQLQSGTWSTDMISAGKRRLSDIDLAYILDRHYGEAFGITDIADISFTLGLTDMDSNELVEPQAIKITIPDAAASFDESGEVVYDENGIQIISKGLVPDSFELSDDIHALFLIKNTSSGELWVDCASGSLSVNGFMTDEITYSSTVHAGTVGILDVELSANSLSGNGCDSIEDIEELEMTLTIRDGHYNTLAEPVITLQFGGEE